MDWIHQTQKMPARNTVQRNIDPEIPQLEKFPPEPRSQELVCIACAQGIVNLRFLTGQKLKQDGALSLLQIECKVNIDTDLFQTHPVPTSRTALLSPFDLLGDNATR